MHYSTYAFLFIGFYMAAMVWVGYWIMRRETSQDFMIGGRNVGLLPTSASLAASFRDGAGIALWLTLGLQGGYGPAFWFFLAILLSSFLVSYLGPKVRAEAALHGHLTISERVEMVVGVRSAKLSAAVTLLFSIFLIALQYHIAGGVFARMLGWEEVYGVALVAAILIVYLVAGGYRSVIITDTIQFFIILSFILLPLFVVPDMKDVANVSSVFSGSLDETLSYVLGGFFALFILPECWQRVISARNNSVVRWGTPLAVVMLVFMTLSLIWFGMGLRVHVPDLNIAEPYFDLFTGDGKLAGWMLGYIALVFVAITMSTQSASCYAFVSTLGKVFMKDQVNSDKRYVYFSRIAMILVLLVTAALALVISDVIRYFFDILGFVVCLAPLYLVAAVAPQPWLGNTPAAREKLDRDMFAITMLGLALYLAQFFAEATAYTLTAPSLPVVVISILTGIYLWVQKGTYKTA